MPNATCLENPDPTYPALHVRVPIAMRSAVDEFARRCGANRSGALRILLGQALRDESLWPPVPQQTTPNKASRPKDAKR